MTDVTANGRDAVFDPPLEFMEVGQRLSNWGRWGERDELGTLNFITPQKIVAAAKLIRSGQAFDLSLPLDSRGPQRGANGRNNPIHLMTIADDESLPASMSLADDMAILSLQCATQWDSLAHVGYGKFLYNGTPTSSISLRDGARRNSIDKLRHRVVGRGVLIDIAGSRGVDALQGGYEIMPEDLESAERKQGVRVGSGDVVLIRTGWQQNLEKDDIATYMGKSAPGIGLACCEWLHDREAAAVATDTQAVEVKPSRDPIATHPIHMVLIRDMGMTMGEMFDLEELARSCSQDGVYEFFFSAPPLKITGAVGSPITPIAIK